MEEILPIFSAYLKTMKRIIFIIFLCFSCLLGACAPTDNAGGGDTPPTQGQETPESGTQDGKEDGEGGLPDDGLELPDLDL